MKNSGRVCVFLIFALMVGKVWADDVCYANGTSYPVGYPLCMGGQQMVCTDGGWSPLAGGDRCTDRTQLNEVASHDSSMKPTQAKSGVTSQGALNPKASTPVAVDDLIKLLQALKRKNISKVDPKELVNNKGEVASQYCYCDTNTFACNPDSPPPNCNCVCTNF